MSHSQHPLRADGERIGVVLVILLLLTLGLLAADGVYASLSARATGTESVSSGTLNLALSPDTGVGFSTFTGVMAPGDTDNVYVNLTNTGTLASAAGMRLWVSALPSTPLSNGAAAGEGLTVRVRRCSVAWTLATGVCGGATTNMMAVTQMSTMNTLATAKALNNVPALAVGGSVAHVQVSLGLVGTEKSVNGVPPVNSIQGHPVTLTYSFIEQQRAGVKTNQ